MSIFPFAAIVGQDQMKLALVLNVINPTIGGVLIMGEKGTAKRYCRQGACRTSPPDESCQRLFVQLRPPRVSLQLLSGRIDRGGPSSR